MGFIRNEHAGRAGFSGAGWRGELRDNHLRNYIVKVGVKLIRKGPGPACRDQ
jgi:hypothetical protein